MLKQFFKDEQGQTTVEYLLIIAVIVVVISMLGTKMQEGVKGLTEKIFANLNNKVDELMTTKAGN